MPKKLPVLQEINKVIIDLEKKLENTAKTEPSLALFVYLDLIKTMIERVSLENMELYSYLDKKVDKMLKNDVNLAKIYDKLGLLVEKKSFLDKIKSIFKKII
jgi:3-methyladenine DNA glycosylase/8-oxoguanine DNA glycosylase